LIRVWVNRRDRKAAPSGWRSFASRESQTNRQEVLLDRKSRGLREAEFVVPDDHPGLKRAIAEVIPQAVWQRCYVHFLRNAPDQLPYDERIKIY
jgi:transposase-like protein